MDSESSLTFIGPFSLLTTYFPVTMVVAMASIYAVENAVRYYSELLTTCGDLLDGFEAEELRF